jgi:hypothetical protein
MVVSRTVKAAKLKELYESEGITDDLEFLEQWSADSVCPAICVNEGCSYTAEMEPDQDRGYCEECHTQTMWSGMRLLDII